MSADHDASMLWYGYDSTTGNTAAPDKKAPVCAHTRSSISSSNGSSGPLPFWNCIIVLLFTVVPSLRAHIVMTSPTHAAGAHGNMSSGG